MLVRNIILVSCTADLSRLILSADSFRTERCAHGRLADICQEGELPDG